MTKLSCLAEVVVSSLKVNSMNSIIMELRKYTPEDGAKLGLEGIILDMIDRTKER